MTKIRDPKLFSEIKKFLTEYLPIIRSRSTHTVQAYRDTLNLYMSFLRSCKHLDMFQVSYGDFNHRNVTDFLEWLKHARNCADSTRNHRLVCLRAFCKYLSNNDVIAFDSYSRIQEIETIPTEDRTLKDLLSLDQMKKLLSLPDKVKPLGVRDHFFIALMYDTGCRDEEIRTMKYGSIKSNRDGNGEVRLIGKGRKYRVTPISNEVMAFFEQYAKIFHPEQNPDKYLFYITHGAKATLMSADNSSRLLRKYEAIAKQTESDFPHLHPHLLRHCRAMHLYQAGMPLSIVGEWLGHSHLETTLIYAYADTEMKRKASEKIQLANGSIFTKESFKYKNDEEALKKLYGLA